MSSSTTSALKSLQRQVCGGRIPLEIRLSPGECRSYDRSDPYLVSFPRLSYLPVLLPQVLDFFSSWLIRSDAQAHRGWFSVNDVPMKWGLPAGLLYDLYAKNYKLASSSSSSSDSTKPWKLVVHFSEWPDNELVPLDRDGIVLHDAFINSVKEADFLRNGTAEHIMKLSKDDSHGLWQSLTTNHFSDFQRIFELLVPSYMKLRRIPLRIFSPESAEFRARTPTWNVLQGSFTAQQTVGDALQSFLPGLFTNTQALSPLTPVLHGAAVPLATPLAELALLVAYGDGWVYIALLSTFSSVG